MQQTFQVKPGQRIVNNKSLAPMDYCLSGHIGAALAAAGRRTIRVEGDGGFTQYLREVGTVAANQPKLKIFLFDDNGYAPIRMIHLNYVGGLYIGCDTAAGPGLPNWHLLFAAYKIPAIRLGPDSSTTQPSSLPSLPKAHPPSLSTLTLSKLTFRNSAPTSPQPTLCSQTRLTA